MPIAPAVSPADPLPAPLDPSLPTILPQNLQSALAQGLSAAVAAFRQALEQSSAQLDQAFRKNHPIEDLVRARAAVVDRLMLAAWQHFAARLQHNAALVAVGGYGRGELHPASDIDILVLLADENLAERDGEISQFLTFLWDIGLEVGHSVRTAAECERQARNDITVMTTLTEARLLAGPEALLADLNARLSPESLWNSVSFFRAKREEQQARHRRYHDTGYDLEPNVKGSPGGLRDIQVIAWVAKRHFGVERLDDLLAHDFLTQEQLRTLKTGQAFLWKVRWALHTLTGRREDRLLFDHQVKLAQLLGYEDASFTLAVEQLMQRYYRTVMELSRINEMLLQRFEEAILLDPHAAPQPINERFHTRNGYLETADPDVFERDPSALMELFLVLAQDTGIKGVGAQTIGLIKGSLYLIDEEFRQNPRNHRMFLELLRSPEGVSRQLRRMNSYGVLGRYIPAFGRIVGRMQFDLFHVYTVDAHTLFVVENLRRLSLPRCNRELPELSRIMQRLPRPEVAYLAGLFHDIAKGRGGDHSELGAVDAESFCLEHGLSRYDARLVAWLVRHHLALSLTAQKKDTSDPEVVSQFAELVGDQLHLDYLYVLTVSDVRATNPTLWNSWKASLFHELYELTRRALRRGLENPIDVEELITETQAGARALLSDHRLDTLAVDALWARFTPDYFQRCQPAEIAWHTRALLAHGKRDKPKRGAPRIDQLELAEPRIELGHPPGVGGTSVLVYAPKKLDSFARVTGVLDELNLNIVDARIISTVDGEHRLETYVVLTASGSPVEDALAREEITARLRAALAAPDLSGIHVTRRASRRARAFNTPVEIRFHDQDGQGRTVLELIAGDRPGLLYRLAKVFRHFGVDVRNARIATVGERAEDVFYVTDLHGQPLSPELRTELTETLQAALNNGDTGT